MHRQIYQFLHTIFLLIPVLFILNSCQKDPNDLKFEMGGEFINTYSKVSVCDTFTVALSTVKIDSIVTSGTDSLLVGKISEPKTGDITALCYFRLSHPASTLIKEGDIYDSISLVVKLNGYSYGDTLIRQKWNIYRLSEKLKTFENGYLYNNSHFSHTDYPDPIGTFTYKPYPYLKEEINIPLDNELGLELFNMALNKDENLKSDENFFNYFKGIAIEPASDEMNTLLGINVADSSVVMRVYAHRMAEEWEDLELDFAIETSRLPFTQFISNREGTPLEILQEQRHSTPSYLTDNETFIQGGTGLMTRIDIPGLSNILTFENMTLIKAELILEPVAFYNQALHLPSKLWFRKCDRLNKLMNVDPYKNDLGTDYIYGILNIDKGPYNENTHYSIDITKYIEDELSDNYFEPGNTALLLYYYQPDYSSSANHIIFGDMNHPTCNPKLKLYFLHY